MRRSVSFSQKLGGGGLAQQASGSSLSAEPGTESQGAEPSPLEVFPEGNFQLPSAASGLGSDATGLATGLGLKRCQGAALNLVDMARGHRPMFAAMDAGGFSRGRWSKAGVHTGAAAPGGGGMGGGGAAEHGQPVRGDFLNSRFGATVLDRELLKAYLLGPEERVPWGQRPRGPSSEGSGSSSNDSDDERGAPGSFADVGLTIDDSDEDDGGGGGGARGSIDWLLKVPDARLKRLRSLRSLHPEAAEAKTQPTAVDGAMLPPIPEKRRRLAPYQGGVARTYLEEALEVEDGAAGAVGQQPVCAGAGLMMPEAGLVPPPSLASLASLASLEDDAGLKAAKALTPEQIAANAARSEPWRLYMLSLREKRQESEDASLDKKSGGNSASGGESGGESGESGESGAVGCHEAGTAPIPATAMGGLSAHAGTRALAAPALAGSAAGAGQSEDGHSTLDTIPVLGLVAPSVRKVAKAASANQPKRRDFFAAALKTQLQDLWAENQRLKEAVRAKLAPEAGKSLLATCIDAQPSVLEDEQLGSSYSQADTTLLRVLREAQRSYVITDPRELDNPIVWVSPSFCALTGYSQGEILGRNCRFLQGPRTDQAVVGRIRKAIDGKYPDSVCLVNYRKDGASFWNNLYISPLNDASGEVVHYIGVQCDVTAAYVQPADHAAAAHAATQGENAARGHGHSPAWATRPPAEGVVLGPPPARVAQAGEFMATAHTAALIRQQSHGHFHGGSHGGSHGGYGGGGEAGGEGGAVVPVKWHSSLSAQPAAR